MKKTFDGPAVIVVPNGQHIDVEARLVLSCPRDDLWSWSGTVTTARPDGRLGSAMSYNHRLQLRMNDDEFPMVIDRTNSSSRTAMISGRNGSWPSFGPQPRDD